MKMKDKIETVPKGAKFLSDWMTETPENCVLSKGITGCGATTLAIKQPGHTILAMPFRGLVSNKAASNPDLLGIHGDMDREAAIANYVKTHDTLKIATTYDSFPFVCDTLEALGFDPYKDFFLFVDEWHILFNSYMFRKQAARHLLEKAKRFDRKTFVSATPIPSEYWLSELTSLPEHKIVWPDAVRVAVNPIKVDDPADYMARLCKSRMKNGGDDNYHIFLNSVEGISKIIRRANLFPTECRIVCSQSADSLKENLSKLPDGFEIQTTLDPVKTFNFYTSTCF